MIVRSKLVLLCFSILPVAYIRAELVLQRVSGLEPDRFTDNEECSSDTCTDVYSAEQLVPDSCQCRCPVSRPTFSIQHMTCISSLEDCDDLTLSDRAGTNYGIFTILVSNRLQITPVLPVVGTANGHPLARVLNCPTLNITAIEYDGLGGYGILELPALYSPTNSETNLTHLQFMRDSINQSRVDISGLLLKVKFKCGSESISGSACLPLKIHGFQNVGRWRTTTTSAKPATDRSQERQPISIPYVVGGTVLAVVVLVAISIAMVIGCGTSAPRKKKEERMRVRRVERHWSINSTRKNPIRRIFRSLSLGDVTEKHSRRTDHERHAEKMSVSALSTASVDSGKGNSRSRSHSSSLAYDNKALSEAVLNYESTRRNGTKNGIHHQPRLFKSHQEKLSTAGHGIGSVPTQTHKQKTAANKKLSPFKRLFSRKEKLGSENSDSKLSIDYDQFCITEAPRCTGKSFSESHVNPDISFNAEGKLAQTEEFQIEVPVIQVDEEANVNDLDFIENELYESDSYTSSQPRHMRGSYNLDIESDLPVTCIDDVAECASEFEVYEHVITSDPIDDFVAI